MTKYLISFPSSAMAELSAEELQAASNDSHAVVEEAKAAGVWVFGGAINEGITPVLVGRDGAAEDGAYPQFSQLSGGWTVLEVGSREEALTWAAKFASACRCAQEVREFHFDPAS